MSNSKRRFDTVTKSAVAHGWASSGLRQADYAQQHGISSRLLRSWLRTYVLGRRWEPEVRDAVQNAVTVLAGVILAMEPSGQQQMPPSPVSGVETTDTPLGAAGRQKFDWDSEEDAA